MEGEGKGWRWVVSGGGWGRAGVQEKSNSVSLPLPSGVVPAYEASGVDARCATLRYAVLCCAALPLCVLCGFYPWAGQVCDGATLDSGQVARKANGP